MEQPVARGHDLGLAAERDVRASRERSGSRRILRDVNVAQQTLFGTGEECTGKLDRRRNGDHHSSRVHVLVICGTPQREGMKAFQGHRDEVLIESLIPRHP